MNLVISSGQIKLYEPESTATKLKEVLKVWSQLLHHKEASLGTLTIK